MRRAVTLMAILVVALLALPASALAGGWAVVVLDPLPPGLENGDGGPHRVGYTVLQHGLHPAGGLRTSIAIRSVQSGQTLEFPGRAEGDAGHYVAEIRFPSVGDWTWEVRPGGFPAQALGTVTVPPKNLAHEDAPYRNATLADAPGPVLGLRGAALDAFRVPLASAALAAWAMFGWSLLLLLRAREALPSARPHASNPRS